MPARVRAADARREPVRQLRRQVAEARARERVAARRARRRAAAGRRRRSTRPPAGGSARSPGTRPCSAAARRRGRSRASGTPSSRMRPSSGSYMPSSSLTSVVLPEPFSPTSATVRPAGSMHVEPVDRGVVGCPGSGTTTPSSRMPSRSALGRGPRAGARAALGRVVLEPEQAVGRRERRDERARALRRRRRAGCASAGSARPPSAPCRARAPPCAARSTTNAIAAIRPPAYSSQPVVCTPSTASASRAAALVDLGRQPAVLAARGSARARTRGSRPPSSRRTRARRACPRAVAGRPCRRRRGW